MIFCNSQLASSSSMPALCNLRSAFPQGAERDTPMWKPVSLMPGSVAPTKFESASISAISGSTLPNTAF